MFKSNYSVFGILGLLSVLAFNGVLHAEELRPVQPFQITEGKGLTNIPSFSTRSGSILGDRLISGDESFDFLAPSDKGYVFSRNSDGIFGEELVMGMKFADWLTLRVNVIDEEDSALNLFSNGPLISRYGQSNDDLLGYQFGLSSVMNISNKWRFGIDFGMGRVGGELMGLYQDQLETARLGFGIRNNKFGATFQSDFMNGMSNDEMGQSTMDLQVDWHFTKDGTISFGARRNIRENNTTANTLDELTGTVPYIKFKHNL